jgi:hypothetical protein
MNVGGFIKGYIGYTLTRKACSKASQTGLVGSRVRSFARAKDEIYDGGINGSPSGSL